MRASAPVLRAPRRFTQELRGNAGVAGRVLMQRAVRRGRVGERGVQRSRLKYRPTAHLFEYSLCRPFRCEAATQSVGACKTRGAGPNCHPLQTTRRAHSSGGFGMHGSLPGPGDLWTRRRQPKRSLHDDIPMETNEVTLCPQVSAHDARNRKMCRTQRYFESSSCHAPVRATRVALLMSE